MKVGCDLWAVRDHYTGDTHNLWYFVYHVSSHGNGMYNLSIMCNHKTYNIHSRTNFALGFEKIIMMYMQVLVTAISSEVLPSHLLERKNLSHANST
jgi:hypothetical protein